MQSDIFRSRRRLLHSFVQLAIKNQALRERTCQRHVFFEAHRSLNTKILSCSFFSPLFHQMLKEVKYFPSPLVSPRRTIGIPRRLRRRRRTCLVTNCKKSVTPPPLGTQTHLLLTHDWPRANSIVFMEIGSAPCSDCGDSQPVSCRRRKKRGTQPPCAFGGSKQSSVCCHLSSISPATTHRLRRRKTDVWAQGPLSSVFVPSRLSIHLSLCCTLFAPVASQLCATAASIRGSRLLLLQQPVLTNDVLAHFWNKCGMLRLVSHWVERQTAVRFYIPANSLIK